MITDILTSKRKAAEACGLLRCVSAIPNCITMSASTPAPIINISAYRFVTIDDCETLRERLQAECERLQLKGTILIAPEGINIFLAGPREAIDAALAWLHADPRFADTSPRRNPSPRSRRSAI